MKKLAIMLALAISLSGCSGGNSNTEDENNGRVRKVYADFLNTIYVDSETNVMYFWHTGGYSGGLTVMVNENGQPLTLYENTFGITRLFIETLEGDMDVEVGDYIIQGVHGEYYSCKPNIFTETYEEIENG